MSREHAMIESIMSNVLSPEHLRNPDVTKVCWNCGKEFHPYRGFKVTSHFCSCSCSWVVSPLGESPAQPDKGEPRSG